MADDIIGTPVERVIPEGWHVARNDVVKKGDVLGVGKGWIYPSATMLGTPTGSCGFIWHAMEHYLVIRRNAPEPSVEELKAKVAELEAENVRLGGLTGVVHDQEETVRWHRLRHLESMRQIDSLKAKVAALTKDRDEWKDVAEVQEGAVERARADNQVLHAKVAELEKALDAERAAYDAKDAEIETLRKERDNWKPYFDTLVTKMDAIRKVMEGA